jgi:hypothetical protein
MENNRAYESLRLIRGKRRLKELVILSEAKRDFEFRRLFISEIEQDLHVVFSREKVSDWVSWGFLSLSLLFVPFSLFYVFISIATALRVYSIYCNKKFKKIFIGYKFALGCVDAVIENDYGIKMPKQI